VRSSRKEPIRVGVIGVGRGSSFAAGATELVGMKRVALPLQPADGEEELSPKQKKDQFRLWKDTWATGKRFVISVAILFLAALLGVNMGVFPYVNAVFNSFMTFLNSLVAMSLLAIIMVVFGTGDASKVMLVQFGIFPFIVLDAYLRAGDDFVAGNPVYIGEIGEFDVFSYAPPWAVVFGALSWVPDMAMQVGIMALGLFCIRYVAGSWLWSRRSTSRMA